MSRQHRNALSPARRCALVVGVALFVGLGAPAAWEGAAHAQKRIVVQPFAGSGGGRIARKTADILEEAGHTIIPFQEYRGAARDLGARGPDADSVAKVATEVDFDAVVFGDIDKSTGIRQVTVRVFASDGRELGVFEFRAKRRRLDRGEQEAVRSRILPLIDQLSGGGAVAPRPPPAVEEPEEEVFEEPEPAPDEGLVLEPDPVTEEAEERLDEDVEEPPSGDGVQQVQDTESAFAPTELRASPDASVEQQGPPATSIRGPIDVAAGPSFTQRLLRSGGQTLSYDGGAPGVRVDAEVYPAGFGPASLPARVILANLGLQVTFDWAPILTSDVPVNNENVSYDTPMMQLGVGLVYRYFFGDAPNAPVLKLGVGYDYRSFSIDRGDVMPEDFSLPATAYGSIAPGLAFRYPISNALAVTGQGRLLLVLGAGEITDPEQYGDTSSALGFDVGVRVEYELIPRLTVRLGAQFVDVTLAFDGTGMKSQAEDVDGITDFYIGGQLTAGYRF